MRGPTSATRATARAPGSTAAECSVVTGEEEECLAPLRAGPGIYELTAQGTAGGTPVEARARWDGQCNVVELVFDAP